MNNEPMDHFEPAPPWWKVADRKVRRGHQYWFCLGMVIGSLATVAGAVVFIFALHHTF